MANRIRPVLQKTSYHCGAAVTEWILRSFGIKPSRHLADMLGVEQWPKGVLPWRMISVLHDHGLFTNTTVVNKAGFVLNTLLDRGKLIALVSVGTRLPNHWIAAEAVEAVEASDTDEDDDDLDEPRMRVMDPLVGYINTSNLGDVSMLIGVYA